ncbi:MAG: hypothetical protein Q9190_006885 [Brigantiaea leucoxantha]
MHSLLCSFLFAAIYTLTVAGPLPAAHEDLLKDMKTYTFPVQLSPVKRQEPIEQGPQVHFQGTIFNNDTRFSTLPPMPYWNGENYSSCPEYSTNKWDKKGLTRDVGSVPITPETDQLRKRSNGFELEERAEDTCKTIASFKFANWTEEVANTFPIQNAPGGYDYLVCYTTNAVVKRITAWLHSPIKSADCCYDDIESNSPKDKSFGTLQFTYSSTIDFHYEIHFAYQHEPVPINGIFQVLRRQGAKPPPF